MDEIPEWHDAMVITPDHWEAKAMACREAVSAIERKLAVAEHLRTGSGGSLDDSDTGDAWYRAQILAYKAALDEVRPLLNG